VEAGKSRAAELRALSAASRKEERKATRSIPEKILDFTGGKEIAQGLATAIALPGASKQLEETQKMQFDLQGRLLQRIKENKAAGQDTSRLEKALDLLGEDIYATGQGAERQLNPNELTEKQVIGDALQLGTTAASGSLLGGTKAGTIIKNQPVLSGVSQLTSKIPSIGSGVGVIKGGIKGALTGALGGSTQGVAYGAAQGLQEDKDAEGIKADALKGGLIGGALGGGLGLVGGAIGGGLKGRALRKEVLGQQVVSGEKVKPVLTPVQQKAVDMAKQQGFDDVDIEFMQTMKPADKLKSQKMIQLAQKAATDKRAIERPIDVVGDSMIDRVKFIESQNKSAGKAVNEVAKSLRGKPVDASNVSTKAKELIDDLGITVNFDNKGLSPKVTGLDFSKSVFKNTPEIQKKLQKFIMEIPSGKADAYDVHIFKKSIDELVDYGTKGEGLKGNSERILKALRAAADDTLDNTFEAYNKANTDFRITKEVLDEAQDLFGKKGGLSKERGGQLLRSVFSNSAQRPRVLKLIEGLDKTSAQYGKQFDDNLVDQALFTEILEDIYGTQATTSLQGQFARALSGTERVIEGVKNPLQGLGDIVGTIAEKSMGISDENKKKILSALLK